MAITFLWIAVLIFKSPLFWTGFLNPFIVDMLPITAVQFMYVVAVLDAVVGIMFLINWKVYWAGLIAALHILGVLVVSGINDITVRDIAIMGAGFALFLETVPVRWKTWLR